jgi:hypothetical protein
VGASPLLLVLLLLLLRAPRPGLLLLFPPPLPPVEEAAAAVQLLLLLLRQVRLPLCGQKGFEKCLWGEQKIVWRFLGREGCVFFIGPSPGAEK